MLSSFCAHCLVHENPEEQCDKLTPKNWIIIGDSQGGGGGGGRRRDKVRLRS